MTTILFRFSLLLFVKLLKKVVSLFGVFLKSFSLNCLEYFSFKFLLTLCNFATTPTPCSGAQMIDGKCQSASSSIFLIVSSTIMMSTTTMILTMAMINVRVKSA